MWSWTALVLEDATFEAVWLVWACWKRFIGGRIG